MEEEPNHDIINVQKHSPEYIPVTYESPIIQQRDMLRSDKLKAVIKINVQGKGQQQIHIYKHDEADELARDFFIQHNITDKKKQ